jgi:hypothetical protein
LGLVLHFALVWGDQPAGGPVSPLAGPGNAPIVEYRTRDVPSYSRPVMRNVDWYSFTDQTGNQWLVEGVREGAIQPAVYYGDL